MNEIATLPADERRLYFEQAAARLGTLTPQLIEKDFWVCWLLRQVFALPEIGPHLTFKGGTSLSKAYRVIERFSEDVDLSIERSYLGFGDDNEPERGASGKERKRRLKALQAVCQQVIAEQLRPALDSAIQAWLPEEGWSLTMAGADDDPDQQSIRFQFPPSLQSGLNSYFAPSVKLELGARSDHYPVEMLPVRPYLSDAFPDLINEPQTTVRVLHIHRTFWEKATILHMLAHRPHEKPIARAMSRHYYDLYQIANHSEGRQALDNLQLLGRVAEHKSVFFASAQARYDEARLGKLLLVPSPDRIPELERDYHSMLPMFFGEAPEFSVIIRRLTALQDQINSANTNP